MKKFLKQLNWKRLLLRTGIVLGVTVLMAVIALFSVLLIINYGPSKRAHKVFVKSVRETSAIGFLGDWFTTKEELAAIIAENSIEEIDEITDVSLIRIPTKAPDNPEGPKEREKVVVYLENGEEKVVTPASDGRVYDRLILDEDGIIITEVSGSTYFGHMMIVLDPSRVFVGVCQNVGNPNASGQKVSQIMERYGAVAATNAGGFDDPNGLGSGTIPLGFCYSEGKRVHNGGSGLLIGFDKNNILVVGNMSTAKADEIGIRDAVTFGPALIVNGNPANISGTSGGLNPRTAIGQREDGAVLLLCIDGRQANSLGATYADLIEIFIDFGAVNAANLDGGSSALMMYKGKDVSSRSNLISDRYLPTTILVRGLE
ncbi:MAG: phosphodiester glycosidase family protein [Lachnospiraceae bacterium]|nr:phosphodiester glycosidase family protein [Lachnospiraceae bacterium]